MCAIIHHWRHEKICDRSMVNNLSPKAHWQNGATQYLVILYSIKKLLNLCISSLLKLRERGGGGASFYQIENNSTFRGIFTINTFN